MKDKFLFLLLDIVLRNGDIRKIIHEGANFEIIGKLTTFALQEKYLIFEENKLIITQKGIEKVQLDAAKFKKTNKDEWIQPDIKNKVTKIDKNDIFLPSQDELTF